MTDTDRLRLVRCFLLDMDGTFYVGDRLVEGALHFIDVIRSQGRDFLFLTNNSSQDARQYAEKITRLGLSLGPDKVLTSGAATAMHLRSQHPGARVYVVGTSALEAEFATRGFVLTDTHPEFAVLGFDTGLTYAKLWRLCDLVRSGLPYLATHPDVNCPTEGGFMPDIGAMIAFVRASTGRDPNLVVGKPNRLIVEKAAEHAGVPLSRLAMVGDRLYTDIALGTTAGVLTVLVLSGETQAEDVPGSAYQPDHIFAHLGALADFLVRENGLTVGESGG